MVIMRPSKDRLLSIIVVTALAITGCVVAFGCQKWEEQRILDETQESVLRQDRQHIQEETESTEEALANSSAKNSYVDESTLTQRFSGALKTSSYHERAAEVGVSASMFPDAPVMLFVLEAPINTKGYSIGGEAPSVREIEVIRVPVGIGADGESVAIDICEQVYWPSDVSGLLWDLDLSELESLKAEPRS